MDAFGKEIFTIEGATVELPRTKRCNTVYKKIPLLVLSKIGSFEYGISPYIDEKYYTNAESLLKIKEIIWYNFFKHGKNYPFEEKYHFPAPFKVYLDYKLGLDVGKDVDEFVAQVRNSIFNFVVYSANSRLISGANWITDGVLRLSDKYGYVVKKEKHNWLKIQKEK